MRSRTVEWNYLNTEPFRVRYAVAAYWLRDCRTILEVGGYRTPISHFIRPDQYAVVLDPEVVPEAPANAEHLAIYYQDWRGHLDAGYGLVLMGLDLQGPDQLDALIRPAGLVVLECAVTYLRSLLRAERIVDEHQRPVLADWTITIGGRELDAVQYPRDGWPVKPERRMLLLGAAEPLEDA